MVNSPIPTDLAGECRKAAKILNSFIDKVIPPQVLQSANGFAIITVIKAGFLFSGRVGSGLVVARLSDGSWSAPSAVGTGGMGFGGQIGAEVTDFVIVLNSKDAVKSFMNGGNLTLGGNLGNCLQIIILFFLALVAAGPIGRNAEGASSVSLKHVAAIFSYSKTRGLFAGVSIEGSVIIERKDANSKFYHRKVSAKELLSGKVSPPPQADILYRALNAKASLNTGGLRGGGGLQRSISLSNSLSNNNNRNNTSQSKVKPSVSKSPTKPPIAPKPNLPLRQKPITALAMFDFLGEQEGDLEFHKGDTIVITKKTDSTNDWWTGKCNMQEGIEKDDRV
ncbi:6338_t:CDS:10 [Diversispora eburnea]|uniref:6338_t:CDS:1 n=1 Tax=Diversispora eburnea TaxID=1213867 RepID=A0A9N8ZBN9_9GLOM|nr:6338_t:CDS:10 [Diversispora eburnea]